MHGIRNFFSGQKHVILTLCYFALLALFVPQAQKRHLGIQGMFFSMIAAGVVLTLLFFFLQLLLKKRAASPLSMKELSAYYSGTDLAHLLQLQDAGMFGGSLIALDPQTLTPLEAVSENLSAQELEPVPLIEAFCQEVISEENPLYLSETYQPDVKSLIGSMVLLIGMRRSGKSNALAVLFEELAHWRIPFVVFDTEGEYQGLVDERFLKRGVYVASAEYLTDEDQEQTNTIALDLDHAYAFGQQIMEGILQVVINLKSWDDETAAKIMCEIIMGINAWQDARPAGKRIPVMLGIDEAQKWLPQDLSYSCVSRETQKYLHEAWFDVAVARGGKRGFGVVAATQRYSQLHKNFLQALWRFLFLQKEERDLDRYQKEGIARQQAKSLGQGECFVFSPTLAGLRVRFRLRRSEHFGKTPGLDQLYTHYRTVPPLQVVLNQSFTGSQNRNPRNQEAVPARYQEQETASAPYAVPQTQERESTGPQITKQQLIINGVPVSRLQYDAYHLFKNGTTKGTDLAAKLTALGTHGRVDNNRAYRVRAELVSAGLIQLKEE